MPENPLLDGQINPYETFPRDTDTLAPTSANLTTKELRQVAPEQLGEKSAMNVLGAIGKAVEIERPPSVAA